VFERRLAERLVGQGDGVTSPAPRPVPLTKGSPTPQPPAPERGSAIGSGLTWLSTWSLRLLLVAAGAVLLGLIVGRLWSVVLPVLLALLLASVLWPPTAWLRRRGAPPALAALGTLLGFLVLLIGSLALLAPSVTSQVGDIAEQAVGGLRQIQESITRPPLNLNDAQAVAELTQRLQASATRVASGVLTGVGAVTSALVTTALSLVLAFFFIKDGPRFLPWLHGVVGQRAGRHLDTVLTRSWATLGAFIQGQAVVGFVDAVLIGIGLLVLGVPLALPLAVLTFFGGFVPIIGAFVVGALAVLVALVTKGTTTALIVTALIFAVQQIEGNVLQPMLQGRSLRLHPGVVLLAVTAGGGLFGIAGAFLSVPVVAVAAVVLRYLGEVADGRPLDLARPATGAEAAADQDALSAEPGAAQRD
jgi:predicted PurR-regulated permease PerM